MLTQNLGFPRIGVKRELKKACESYWQKKSTVEELQSAAKEERRKNWQLQQNAGITLIPSNDFSFYDHVQDVTFMLGAIPKRYEKLKTVLSETDLYFATCRGYQSKDHDITAMEMTKWFDTNYHYIVPEFEKDQQFSLFSQKAINEYKEAKEQGIDTKPVLVGPLSYLLLGKEKTKGFHRLELINNLLPVYFGIIRQLQSEGAEWIQLDEPYLAMDLSETAKELYGQVYQQIRNAFPSLKIMVATYFGDLRDNQEVALNLPINALHLDLVRGEKQLKDICDNAPESLILSLGVVDGRNIWKNDFQKTLKIIEVATEKVGLNRVIISPSCSLLHSPYDLDLETNEDILTPEVKNWLAFAKQKLEEVNTLARLAGVDPKADVFRKLGENTQAIQSRKHSEIIHKAEVKQKTLEISVAEAKREKFFDERIEVQNQKFGLPLLPTTTIGSFPQTKEVRKLRANHKKGKISELEYREAIQKETEKCIRIQEEIGIDVLVHGEFERNDMVEYFGEKLNGFVFTQNGWVQSYGSRGVKPPIIFGDVDRPFAMTVEWSEYAQSLTQRKVKGMLTGPVTILQWSFVRDDQPRKQTALQIALALQREVLDLEKAGIDIIQIDEPAIREGLPLRESDREEYLNWAVHAFRVCSSSVKNETQIHTHMCYSEFNDIIRHIAEMDADVISIETSRSQMELLDAFSDFKYPNQIGPGVYDIHSPRVPTVDEMKELIHKASDMIPVENIWINPDCGLKTRDWPETKSALENIVRVAKDLRTELSV